MFSNYLFIVIIVIVIKIIIIVNNCYLKFREVVIIIFSLLKRKWRFREVEKIV